MVVDERTVPSADGVEIAFDAHGRGNPALVFVHGWSGRRGHWDEQVDHFARDHRVVRLDLAGHGASGHSRDRWTVAAFADDVVAVCDALAFDRIILIGHSLGGSVIALAAQRLGGRVVGVIGIDTWSSLGVRASTEEIGASVLLPEMRADFVGGSRRFAELMCGPTTPPALAARIVAEVTTMPGDIATAILDDAIQHGPDDIEDSLRSLDVPKSAISSTTFRPKDPALLASFGIDNVVLSGTGHYLMLEQPAAFNALLAAAIERSAGVARR